MAILFVLIEQLTFVVCLYRRRDFKFVTFRRFPKNPKMNCCLCNYAPLITLRVHSINAPKLHIFLGDNKLMTYFVPSQ